MKPRKVVISLECLTDVHKRELENKGDWTYKHRGSEIFEITEKPKVTVVQPAKK